jgi:arginase
VNERFAEFDRVFRLFDANGDGVVTRQEIEDALEVLGRGVSDGDRGRLLQAAGRDGVGRDAFIDWMATRKDLDANADLRQIFELCDVDRSGKLSIDELAGLIRCFSVASSEAAAVELARRADTNGDGLIDFEEFLSGQARVPDLKISMAALRAFKKTLRQYVKASEVHALSLVEVDSEIGAGKRGASMGIPALKTAAIQKQAARMRAENGVISLDSLRVQTENNVLFRPQTHKFAKYIDAVSTVLTRTAELLADSFGKGLFPVVLGGDHSTAAGTIAGIKRAFPDKRLGVVWIDAHADIHSPYTTPSGNMHGMPLAIATQTDNLPCRINEVESATLERWEYCKVIGGRLPDLSTDDVVYVAVRDTEDPEKYLIRTREIPIFTTRQVRDMGAAAVARACLDRLHRAELIYVSFDVDSMDSTVSMGTGTPVPGGIFVEEARQLNAALASDPRVCCWEICEINPLLDTLNTMAENSLGVFESVVDTIAARLDPAAAQPARQ